MLNKKRAQLIKIHRRKNIQDAFQRYRQRELLKKSLNEKLVQYLKCALVTGDGDYLNHTSYLDCESFVFFCHEEMYRLIAELTLEQSKQQLITFSFPCLLLCVQETIQGKTLELDEQMKDVYFNSRNQVLSSIAQLMSLLSSDQDLIEGFGSNAPILMVKELMRNTIPGRSYSCKDYNLIIGLINLFRLPQLQDYVYQELQQINFEFFMEKYLRSLMSRQQAVLNHTGACFLIVLLREYLEYQHQNTTKIINQVFQKELVKFILKAMNDNIEYDLKNGREIAENQLIDEFLCILLFVKPIPNSVLTLLKNTKLFKKNTYIDLLFNCSYFSDIVTLECFDNLEILELLHCLKDLQDSDRFDCYLKNLAASFGNMLMSTEKYEQQTERLWNLIRQTNTIHFLCDGQSEIQGVEVIARFMELYRPSDL